MKTVLEIIKGVHPGKFLERELKKHIINNRQFALSIGEHPQTIGAIINGKRRMNIALSLKIEEKLHLEEGFLMTLQLHYDIKLSKFDPDYKPDLSKIRKGIFWDTTFEKIEWNLMKRTVVERVFSYGNDEEQQEIIRFYGKNKVDLITKDLVVEFKR
ncbi:MAG: helix-turn-helix domain-containing protein [Flavobacterium sp.]|nr:helix-turn-helix domain-containing protein [Flavobacterium sp.]